MFNEVVDRAVEGPGLVDGLLQEEAELGGVLTAVKVVGDNASELVGEGNLEGLIDRISIRVKHLHLTQ